MRRERRSVVAVEAMEGTDETIRRGGRLAGPGAVVVKAVAPSHDYRFDIPTVGAATLEAMREGGATALAVPADRVLLLDRDEVLGCQLAHDLAGHAGFRVEEFVDVPAVLRHLRYRVSALAQHVPKLIGILGTWKTRRIADYRKTRCRLDRTA